MCFNSNIMSCSVTFYGSNVPHSRFVYTEHTGNSNTWQADSSVNLPSVEMNMALTNHPFRNQDRNWQLRRAVASGEKITLKRDAH